MKKYIFLVKQMERSNNSHSFVVAAFDSIEKAENYRSTMYLDSDKTYMGFIEMIELK